MVRSLRAPNSPNPGSKTTNFSQVLIVLALGLLLTAGFSTPVHAQGSLALGSVQHVTALLSCPGSGWFVTHCSTATIANCANVKDMGFTFGYIYPTAPYRGTIVFLTGGDGTIPATDPGAELTYAGDYFNAGYEIVQIAWNYGWELTDVPGVPGPPPLLTFNMLLAVQPLSFNTFTTTTSLAHCKPACVRRAEAQPPQPLLTPWLTTASGRRLTRSNSWPAPRSPTLSRGAKYLSH
jgi:hypothetical protein